jgi:hypothetical protein
VRWFKTIPVMVPIADRYLKAGGTRFPQSPNTPGSWKRCSSIDVAGLEASLTKVLKWAAKCGGVRLTTCLYTIKSD